MKETRSLNAGSQVEDQGLVKACLAGDEKAWEQLVQRYQKMIHAVTVRFGFDLEERREILQTVFCEVLKNLPSLLDTVKLRPWILTITVRECNDLIRQKYRQRQHDPAEAAVEISDPHPDSLEIYLRSEREQLLREAMDDLPERCREVVTMLFLGPTTPDYEALGKRFGLSKESIGSLRQRCLSRLRQILESKDS